MTAGADLYTMFKSIAHRQMNTFVSKVLAAVVWNDHLFLPHEAFQQFQQSDRAG